MWIEKAHTEYDNYRIPGLIMTDKGTLIAYYECRRALSDWADIDLKVIRSCDKGETWETVKIIPSGGDTTNNPVMIADGNSIHFLYLKNYKQLYYCRSTDDGVTFSDARELKGVFEEGGFFYNAAAIGPGHSIVHNGVLIIPAWFAYNKEDNKKHLPSFVASIYSKDGGKTWHLGEKIESEELENGNECAYAVTAEGEVLISIRNTCPFFKRFTALSKTGYDGWHSISVAENLPDPFCQGSMDSKDGKIYHINCARNDLLREDLTIKISDDCFQSYESIFVDEIGGYSDIAVSDDYIYVIYEKSVEHGLCFRKIIKK